jgi:DNA-binding NarL/FixJ family response regulator
MVSGFQAIMNKGGGIEQIEVVKNEKDLFLKLDQHLYDLLILDPYASGYFSSETAVKLKEQYPKQKVLIISDTQEQANVLKILEKGVQGYLTRQCDEDEIIHAIFAIAKGEKFYCNKVLDIILNKQFTPEEKDNCDPTVLTERESEITGLIASGMTNKEIAEQLHLSPHTVHSHRKNIIKKLGVKSVSELTVYAMNVGLIDA